MKPMRSLLWKDFRLNRGLLMLGASGLIAVYAVGLAIEISYVWPAMLEASSVADAVYSYGHMAIGVLPFVAALLGGNAIACERADRSAHFLAFMPATKLQILASKSLVATGGLAVLWCANAIVIYAIVPLLHSDPTNFLHMLGSPWAALSGCMMTFGVGWLTSAWMEKAIFPVLAALVSPVALSFSLLTFAAISGHSRVEVLEWVPASGASAGLVAFAIGAWIYFRRVEP